MDNNNINYLKIQSVNCQGLGDKSKRKDVFNYLHNKKYNIFFLQDTHFVQEDEKMIQTQWGFEAYFSSYRSNARGVAIFFKNNFEFKVNDAFSDINGNSLMLDVTIENKQYLLVNIYGPNEDNPQFYKDIGKKIETVSNNHYIIMGGDFNMVMDKNLDTMNYKNLNNPKARSELINQMESLNLSDIFRCANPQLKRFTWRKKIQLNKQD